LRVRPVDALESASVCRDHARARPRPRSLKNNSYAHNELILGLGVFDELPLMAIAIRFLIVIVIASRW
jgi:hypothetical protein